MAPHASRKGSGVNLAEVLDRWTAERQPRSKTASEWTAIVKKFTELHGELSLRAIEKAHVLAYKDSMVAAGKAQGTVKKNLAALHSLLEYAVDNDLAAHNPAASVRVKATKSKTREHIPVEDLQRLFSGDVFTKGERQRRGAGEAAFWLPLLALWTGCRLEELGQMLVEDVKRTDDIDYFEVTDQGDGQKLKNEKLSPLRPDPS